ncbi:anti-sigma factor family protein [Falsigemmobacter intermedius]|uniref:Anti-sigma factor n=1 Tax=Falsigemmobacter intermedius TaxID=1553448 RepID=A0A444MB46_9RHOB|nr:anti-sigma factor [Falsigemmobacter intermedius]RWY40962.1 anti-sigma factor [Falsigemmobacter intermedius]
MPMRAEPGMTELDLTAYVDGQLDEWHAARVEAWLGDHPQDAARVMQDIRLQRELRLALSGPVSAGAQRASERLARGFRRDAWLGRGLKLTPAVLVCALLGLFVSGVLPVPVGPLSASVRPPDYVTAAFAAREAIEVRLPMQSMPEDPFIDAEELRAATGIILPLFDRDWQVIDAQVFPSPQGPGIEILFETPDLGRLHHFAVRPGDFALTPPQSLMSGGAPVAWFQIGETAHVLIAARGSAAELTRKAEALSANLY